MTTEADLPRDAHLGPHDDEPHDNTDTSALLNWLRAAVLGANDGIVSTAGVVMGVAGATDDSGAIANGVVARRVGSGVPDLEHLTPTVLDPAIHAVFVASGIAALALVLVGVLMPQRVREPDADEEAGG